jgi:hypothetical protein
VPVEEISNSSLLADESGQARGIPPEEISESALVDDPDGEGPAVVTEAYAPQDGAGHGQWLPELPKATPPPDLAKMPQPSVIVDDRAHDEVAAQAEQDAQAYQAALGGGSIPAPPRQFDALVARGRVLLRQARSALLASAVDRPGGRPPWLLPAVTLAGLFVGVGLVAVIFSVAGHSAADAQATPQAPGTASAAATTGSTAPPAPAAAAVTPCFTAGPAQVVAASALVGAGVEVRPFGDGVALGFASDEHAATALRLDPGSLSATATAAARSTDTIRRVRPIATPKDALGIVVDSDRKNDKLHARRTLPFDPPLQVGSTDSDVVWAHVGGPAAGKLWSIDGADGIDAVRAASEGAPGDTTTVLSFRKGTSIFVGTATGYRALAPKGELTRFDGLGPTIGSPAVAINEGVVMVAWADRPSADAPWRLRFAHGKAGDAAEPATFTPPAGGPGSHVMSPSLTAVPGGRFLLVWTEGPTSKQRVRGITLSASGEPAGRPLEISNEAVNSGQGQAAVIAVPGAKGVVAFLQAHDDGFQIAATPIVCGG